MTATARATALGPLLAELEALTPQVSAAVSAKDYERFSALQAQQEKLMSRLLASLTQEALSGLEETQRDRLRELVRRREAIQADLTQWSEALRSELVLINQNSRVLKHYR
ncbi:hypothetical protein JW897_03680 [Chromobacterium alkanivorans]|uniref:hypothetical protein n=1 Tax=Chromobacterium TaxID=535 RepID=UPI0006532701|nr:MULTISPECIES: hypothetical protein [Chromobacterium]KMN81918.1 hypothetical protein VK98_12520 [Chromobacterium sp. LK11]MBN3002828.1 hypothetical protein [Chromobacterium alkanivorans]